MIRAALKFVALALFLAAGPGAAQTPATDEPLTPAEVAEIATMLDGLVTGAARYGETEKLAWQALALVHDDFGEESREALEIERIIVMTVVLQGRADEDKIARGLQKIAARGFRVNIPETTRHRRPLRKP